MLPTQSNNILNVDIVEQPSLTYSLDVEKGIISGQVDGIDAILQAAKKILMTERYAYVIYSAKYGAEIESLIGQDFTYISTVLEQRITDALLEDERILSITDFVAEKTSTDTMHIFFHINTAVGSGIIDTEVQLQ